MKLILSRKGFDSSAGGVASPVFENRALVALPIPEPRAASIPSDALVRYDDIAIAGDTLGAVVAGLTERKVAGSTPAHLDPDLRADARPRAPGWRPAFGQANAAQAHLRNQGVGPGNLFLFWGWFRDAAHVNGRYHFRPGADGVHAVFGWLQVDTILSAGPGAALPPWALAHPHATTERGAPDVLYVAREALTIDGVPTGLPGGGVFERLHDDLVLTARDADGRTGLRSRWRLPRCFRPEDGRPRMSYHRDPARWEADPTSADHVLLRTVAKGQEFVVDAPACPGVLAWAADLIVRHGAPPPEAYGRRVLLMVRELHRLGYERLRIAPGLAPSGGAWRCSVVPTTATCRENGALTPPGPLGPLSDAAYTTGMKGQYFAWPDAERDTPAQLAAKFVERFPGLVADGRGEDRAYVAWYEAMLRDTAPTGLPYAYWDSYGDWDLGMSHLKTTAEGPVRVPPPGAARWEPLELDVPRLLE